MSECLTLSVTEEEPGDGGSDEPEQEGSPEIPTLSSPNSANSGEEFTVSYQVCCNDGNCPYGIELYVNSDEVYSEQLNLTDECTSGNIGVTIDGNGEYIVTLVYGNRAMDRSIQIEGDSSDGGDVITDPGDGSGDGGDDPFPDLPGDGSDGGDEEPSIEPELPFGLTRNQAIALGGGAIGVVVLTSGSGGSRPVRFIRGGQ